MSSSQEQPNDGVAKKGIKKMDTIVTGVILGGIIASIYGVSKLRERDQHEQNQNMIEPTVHHEERRSFWKRIFGSK